MPIYTIKAPDGRIADIKGDAPPTEAQMQSIFASLQRPDPQSVGLSQSTQAGVFPEEQLTTGQSALGTLQNILMPGKTLGTTLANLITGQAPSGVQRAAELEQGALAGGAANTLSAGLTDAIAKRSGVPLQGREAVGTLAPISQSLGEVGGAFIPIGGSTAGSIGGTSLKQAAKQGAKVGSVIGGLGGAAQAVENPDATLEDYLTSIGIGTTAGAAGGAVLNPLAVKGIRGLIPSSRLGAVAAQERVATNLKDGSNIIADLARFPKSEPVMQSRLLNREYAQILPEISQNAEEGAIKNVDEFLEASEKALKVRGETFRPIIQAADPALLENKAAILGAIENRLISVLPENTSRETALAKVKSFVDQATPENLLDLSHQINNDLINYYRAKTPEMAADVVSAKKAVRDEFAQIIRGILDDADVDPDAYSKYGIIGDLIESIGTRFRDESITTAEISGKGIIARGMEEINTLNPGPLAKGIGRTIAPEILGEARRMDRQVAKLFKENVPEIGRGVSPDSFAAMTPQQRAATITAAQVEGQNVRQVRNLQDIIQSEQNRLAATPEELFQYQRQEAARAEQNRRVQSAVADSLESIAATEKRLARDVIQAPATTLLEDFYHLRNKGMDTARVEGELARRLTLKKDSKSWGDIRDALGIVQPIEVPNLPKARELNLEEIIRNNQMR